MSRQSKSEKKRIIAKDITRRHLNGEKGPTPKGGPFPCRWVMQKKIKSSATVVSKPNVSKPDTRKSNKQSQIKPDRNHGH